MPRAAVIAIAVATLALAAISFAIIVATPEVPFFEGWGFRGYDAVFAVILTGVGLVVALGRPGNVIGTLLLVSALLSGLTAFASAYGGVASLASPLAAAAWWVSNWLWFFSVLLLVQLLLLFPDGRPLSRGWARAGTVVTLAVSLTAALWALVPQSDAGAPRVDPLGLGSDHPWGDVVGMAALSAPVALLVGFASLARRMRSGSATLRQQAKWVAFAAVAIALAMGAAVIGAVLRLDPAILEALELMSVGTVPLAPIAVAIAVFRYRLYDIDVIINRALVYGVLSGTLATVYVAVVVLFQTFVSPHVGGSEIGVAVSTLLTLALVQPLRRRIQDAVDRRFYRARYDAARTLDRFATRLRDEVDLDHLRRDLLDVVGDTVRPAHAGVWLRHGGS